MQLACDIKLQVRMQGNFSKQEHKLYEQAYVWMRTKVSSNKHRILPTPYIPLHAAQEKPRVIGLTNSRDVQNAKMLKSN